MYTLFDEKQYFNVHGVRVTVSTKENYGFLQQLYVEYGVFEEKKQFLEADINFIIGEDISHISNKVVTKCGNFMSIRDGYIYFSGQNINNPFFYIDDFRPYFTNIIYHNLALKSNMLMLHAGSFSLNEKGYLLIGESGCGKSSLTLLNVLSGGSYLSNDITYIGKKEGKINIFALPQVMNLGDLALSWFCKEMGEEFHQFCCVEKEKKYNKKPKTCVQVKREKVNILVENLNYIIFPEQDFNADQPWYEVLDATCAFPKIISQIKTFDRVGYRKTVDTLTYIRNLKDLFDMIKENVICVNFYWTKDHKRNMEVLRNICVD